MPDDTKSRLLDVSKRDGVFWISFDDFCENFTNFELGSAIEHLNPDAAGKNSNGIVIIFSKCSL